MTLLFNIPETLPRKETCRTCKHRERWQKQANPRVFQYCGVRKSGLTNNGLLKIKCKNEACKLYKKE